MNQITPRHRRSRIALALAVVGTLSLSACSDVGRDAARVGNASLDADEFAAWLDDVAAAQPATFLAPSGAVSAAGARELLTRWISARILTRVIEDEGGDITDADRTAARQQVEDDGQYAGVSDASLDRLAEFEAALLALDRTIDLSADEAAALYDEGVEASGVVCARAIVGAEAATVEDALARVEAGEDFTVVADDVNPPGNFGEGGAVVDRTGNECIPIGVFSSGVAPAVSDAVLTASIGVPTAVVELGDGGVATLLLRPFDEVTDQATEVMAGSAAQSAGRDALQSADDVEVASRYGRWDAEQMAVVAVG